MIWLKKLCVTLYSAWVEHPKKPAYSAFHLPLNSDVRAENVITPRLTRHSYKLVTEDPQSLHSDLIPNQHNLQVSLIAMSDIAKADA